jgi:hypothetical protein
MWIRDKHLGRIVQSVAGIVVMAALIYANFPIYRALVSTYIECRNAPKVVPFHQGMTLCPGQGARFEMQIPIAPANKGERI